MSKEMGNKKDCMVQVCLQKPNLFGGWSSDVDIVEDTELITRKEADELWDKWLPRVVEQLKEGANPEMGIWINCKDTTDYHTSVGHIDYTCIVEDNSVYKKVRVTKEN